MFSPISAIVELYVADYFNKKYGQCIFHPVGYYPWHDGTSLGGRLDIRYEVKLDAKAREEGNLAIEKSCRGETSGINRTSAFTWVHLVPDANGTLEGYEFVVSELREAIKHFPTKWGGDGKQSELAIIPIEQAARLAVDKFPLAIPWPQLGPYWQWK